MTRSMIFENQKSKKFINEERDFMFGCDLLVSPVIRKGAKTQTINLPEGNWYNLHTYESTENKSKITTKLEADKIPVSPEQVVLFLFILYVSTLRKNLKKSPLRFSLRKT